MATLRVRTSQPRQGRTQYSYELMSGTGMVPGPTEQEHVVDVNQALVKGLCREIDLALRQADENTDGAALRSVLAQKGKLLHNTLFPPLGQSGQPDLVSRLRTSTGALLVDSNESLVPWELLHDGENFLGLAHAIGRRAKIKQAAVRGRGSGAVRRALVVGDTLGDLPSAKLETEQVSAWLTGSGVTCTVLIGADATLTRVIEELADEANPYDLFHFSGHVSAEAEATGLMVDQRELIDVTALNPLAESGTPPVVFINGCASAAPSLSAGARALAEATQTMSACMAFMVMGSKTVIGTRTPVGDAGALRFAESFYGLLRDEAEAGTALREARAALEEQSDTSWASFVLYGDPGARITPGESPEPPAEPKPEADPYTPQAADLLRRTQQFAQPRGLVTSVDLLSALLDTEEVRARAATRIGVKRLDLLTDVLRQVQNHTPGSSTDTGSLDTMPFRSSANGSAGKGKGPGKGVDSGCGIDLGSGDGSFPGGSASGGDGRPDGPIGYSDTIARVLHGAHAAVQAAGREAVGVDDIAAAFLETGVGSCAELLQLFGIRPDRLLSPAPDPQVSRDRDRIQLDGLDPRVAAAVQVARLMAAVKGKRIGTYLLLQAFGVTGSEVLREALAEQGEAGVTAFRKLSALGRPKAREFSSRTLAALEHGDLDAEEPVGEEAVLISLLTDGDSSAREILQQLGVQPELVIQALRGTPG